MALKGKGDKEESRRELETAIRLSEKAPFADLEDAKKALASLVMSVGSTKIHDIFDEIGVRYER